MTSLRNRTHDLRAYTLQINARFVSSKLKPLHSKSGSTHHSWTLLHLSYLIWNSFINYRSLCAKTHLHFDILTEWWLLETKTLTRNSISTGFFLNTIINLVSLEIRISQSAGEHLFSRIPCLSSILVMQKLMPYVMLQLKLAVRGGNYISKLN